MNPETFQPAHFHWDYADGVATVTLNRPERKNPLTFESYAELRDTFRALVYAPRGQGGGRRRRGRQFQLGRRRPRDHRPADRDGHAGPARFTRMTGDLVKAMRGCPQPIVAALDGVCVGAGAILAMASDIRIATPGDEDRLPVHPRRPRRLRHGRLRDPAADHRPGPRLGAALHRPGDERRGRRALGLPQQAGRRSRSPKRRRWRAASPPARPSPTASPRPSSTPNGR